MTAAATDARRLGRLYLTAEALPLIFAAGAHAYVVREDVVPEGQDPPAIVPMIRTLDRLPSPSEN